MEDLTKLSIAEVIDRANRPVGTSEEKQRCYAEIGRRREYQPDFTEVYKGVQTVVDAFADLVPEHRDEVRILDVGAGTGHVSEQMRICGFTNIDGLDPSEAMLSMAKENNLYKNYICEFLTEKPLNIEEGTYDGAVMSGAFVGGHMPCVALYEIIRLLKKGAYFCFNIREEYLETVEEYRNLESLMDKLEKEGKWKKIERRVYPDHFYGKSGILYCYKKL